MTYYTSDDHIQDNQQEEYTTQTYQMPTDQNKLPPINQKQRIKKSADVHEPKVSLSAHQMNPDHPPYERRIKPSDLEIINEDIQSSDLN